MNRRNNYDERPLCHKPKDELIKVFINELLLLNKIIISFINAFLSYKRINFYLINEINFD